MKFLKVFFRAIIAKNAQDIKVVVICIIGATTFWFLIALNKNYTTTLLYPFKVKYDKEKFIELAEIPKSIPIKVTGQGWDLIKELSFYYKNPLFFIPSQLPTNIKLSSINIEDLFNENSHHVELKRVLIDSLNVSIDQKVQKTLLIKVNKTSLPLKYNFEVFDSIKIYPNNVILSGPKSIINQIKDTFYIDLANEDTISNNYFKEWNIRNEFNELTTVKNVEISFKVSRLFEYEIAIPINNALVSKKNIKAKIYTFDEIEIGKIDLNKFIVELDSISSKSKEIRLSLNEYPNWVNKAILLDSIIKFEK